MNTSEEIQELKKIISGLEKKVAGIESRYSGIELDQQRLLKTSGKKIKPGMFSKVAIDASGLVTNGSQLEVSDIPDIPISSVEGLESKLAEVLLLISKINEQLPESNSLSIRFDSKGSGTKINYDEHGLVESSAELLATDIPELPIEKISGLDVRLQMVQDHLQSLSAPDEKVVVVNPGTYLKVTVDNQGRVTKGSVLSVNDIPVELINRISTVENLVSTVATSSDINFLKEQLLGKIDATNAATGTFYKVSTNANGLVTSGVSELSVSDLPKQLISDLKQLQRDVLSKADSTELINLHNTIAGVASTNSVASVNQLMDHIQRIEKELKQQLIDLKQETSSLTRVVRENDDGYQQTMQKMQSQISIINA